MKRVKHVAKKASKLVFLYVLGRIAYLTGLTGIIPFLFLVALPEEAGNFVFSSFIILAISTPLIFVGVYSTYRLSKRDPAKMCKRLGGLTLIPGAFGLLLLFFSKETLVKTLDSLIPQMQNAERIDFVLSVYIERVVPSVSSMILAYVIIGITLYLYGRRREKGPLFCLK
ncbi:hypothetical protein J4410_04740 [Candidatus Woesearchaeota archaeon]|nr:hypothetical protein [Candidatus Woesearchaeota archaeon]